MKTVILAGLLSAALVTPAIAEDPAVKPQAKVVVEPVIAREVQPLAAAEATPKVSPEPEAAAIAPYNRCSGHQTVYLTN
jgi:hypothetical protein